MQLADAQLEELARLSWQLGGDDEARARVDFDALSAREQAANRSSAAFISVLLAALGYEIVTADTAGDPISSLSEEEVEAGARLEHLRWARFTTDGPGPRPDHPHLKPYDQLSEEVKEQDRSRVRSVPRLLGLVGLAMQRRREA